MTSDSSPRLRAIQEREANLTDLVVGWKAEIAEFAVKDDPYYNGVRQCLSDLEAVLEDEPDIPWLLAEVARLTHELEMANDECSTCRVSRDVARQDLDEAERERDEARRERDEARALYEANHG